jgi:hypothetical protein
MNQSVNSAVTYKVPPTIETFMKDNTSAVKLIMGPWGSGKTTGCIMELLKRASEEYPDHKGVRQTRFVVVRNTSSQLRQTVLEDIKKWLTPIMNYKVTDSTIQIRFNLADGTKVHSDWLMIPLDTTADIERLLSLNITGGWISEFRQVPIPIVEALYGRCGRFRALGVEKNKWQGVIAESNPPDEDSDWYIRMELEKPKNWSVYKQPGGLDPAAENVDNLRANYYDDLKLSNTPDWCDVHIDSKYGKSLSGQAVFRSSFRPEFHVANGGLKTTTGYPLMLGQDFGRTPAALVTQIDVRGRLLILAEQTSTDMGLEQFLQTLLKPHLARKFPGFPIFMVADPAGRQKSQINEESPFDALKRLGFSAYAAPSNDIETRLRAVEQLFLRNVDGGPAIVIDGLACPLLVRALKFEYRYRRKQTGDLDDKPEKSHPASDLADCLQYAALGATGNYSARVVNDNKPKQMRRQVSSRGWC